MIKLVLLGENVSVHVQKWIRGLIDHKGIELHVISFKRGIEITGVEYYWIKQYTKTKLDYFLNIARVRRIVKSIQPDLIHAHHSTSHGFMASMTGFQPMIITGWGSDILDSPKNPLLKILLTNSFKKASAITVLSYFTREAIRSLTTKEVEIIPFGVDTDKFSPKEKEREILKIGTIRTLSEKYGVEYLIRAFARVAEKYPNMKLEIVGDGPQFDFLNQLTIELKIETKVLFHGFVNQNSEERKYLRILEDFDVFAMLSVMDSETFGVAGVEAMSCGIPVIASNKGGLTEVVGDTGMIVPAKDVSAIALALEELVLDGQLRKVKGVKAREKVLRLYDWKKNVSAMVSLYKRVLDRCQNE